MAGQTDHPQGDRATPEAPRAEKSFGKVIHPVWQDDCDI